MFALLSSRCCKIRVVFVFVIFFILYIGQLYGLYFVTVIYGKLLPLTTFFVWRLTKLKYS